MYIWLDDENTDLIINYYDNNHRLFAFVVPKHQINDGLKNKEEEN